MRRDLSTVRKLEKIEKELGYCDIKIEKGQRLCAQLQFLKLHREALAKTVSSFEPSGSADSEDGNRLGGLSLVEVYHEVSLEPDSGAAQRLRDHFRVAGVFTHLIEERESLERDIEEVATKIESFDAFLTKRRGLRDERRETLNTFNPVASDSIHRISEEFERTEQNWNVLTEDLMNIDEALFHVNRAAEYLASARNHVLVARSQFAIDQWLRDGYLIDLFKHSPVGRAKEMVEGADRNLKKALVEIVCLEDLVVDPEDFEHLLLPFIDHLFEDLFAIGKLNSSLDLLETRGTRLEAFHAKLQAMREQILARQTEHEENRERLFHKIGDARRKLTLPTS